VALSVAFWAIVAGGAGLAVLSSLRGWRAYATEDSEIWVLLALAVAADFMPFRLPPPARRTTTFLLSPAFCFSILILYPPANGVIAQLVALAVAAPRLRLRWPSLAFLTARLVCSFAAAGWAADLLRGPTQQVKYIPGPQDIGVAVPVALVFLGVTLAISLVGALLSDATKREVLTC
jgi:hypothetical protein